MDQGNVVSALLNHLGWPRTQPMERGASFSTNQTVMEPLRCDCWKLALSMTLTYFAPLQKRQPDFQDTILKASSRQFPNVG